jgi:tetratricopeptide (TPR) repeat protein
MHELVRQYAAEKLAAAPQTQYETHDRHCAYYAAFLQRREAGLVGAGAGEALAAIKAEAENIRAAWHWAVAQAKLKEIEHSLNGLARLYLLAGPFQEGETLVRLAADRVRTLIEKMDRPERDAQVILGRLLAEQARFLNKRGLYSQAVTAACAAIDLAQATQSADLEAAGHVQWGMALWNLGNCEAARPPLEQALVLAQTAQLHQVEADSLYNLGFVCWHLGDYAGARGHFERALNLYRAIGDRQGESASLNRLGTISHDQHDYVGGRTYCEQALRICREIGERHGESITLGNLGLACNQQGDYAGARACYEQALRITREMGDRRNEGIILVNLGYAFNQQGDYDRAGAYYEQSLRIYREIGDRQSECLALSCLGLLAHQLGNDKVAREYGRQAVLIAQEIGNRRVEGYALTRLGHALTGLGHLDEAAEVYRRALALRQELGQTNLVMESLAGLARVALAQRNLPRAQTCVEEILNHLAVNSLDGTDEPFRVYLTCYRVLRANRDPRAQAILDTACCLLQERAARISEQELRRSFLGNVVVHREIVEESSL